MLASTAVVTLVATRSTIDVLFFAFPFLIWAAIRFQLAGAASCSLIVSVITALAAADGTGPFKGHQLSAQMFILQAFDGTTALTALSLSALIAERNRTHQRIAQACGELVEVVARLTPGESAEDAPPFHRRAGPGKVQSLLDGLVSEGVATGWEVCRRWPAGHLDGADPTH
jgi:hypothetical protein